MFFFFKSLSRSVHDNIEVDQDQEELQEQEDRTSKIGLPTSLTVWRKSLLVNCNGFTVINSNGDLVYRVDNYILHPHEIILMDASGKSILSMLRRKKLGFGDDSWLVYEGEMGECCSKKPIWSVKKHNNNILQGNYYNNNKKKKNVLAYVFKGSEEKKCSYVIEGCYMNRSCKVVDELSRNVVAEIKKKETMILGVSFGVEVFVLVVNGGFDPGFAMGLVLLLDQMFS